MAEIRDYPMDWPRKLDFMPPLGLQTAVNEGLELYHLKAKVTMQKEAPKPRKVHTEFGEITAGSPTSNKVDYKFGEPDPRNGYDPIPQKELLDDIYDGMGSAIEISNTGMPDIVISERCGCLKIGYDTPDLSILQGSEYLFFKESKRANLIRRKKQMLGVKHLFNPYRYIKSELLTHDIIQSESDPVLKKIRSTLRTDWVIADAVGWGGLGKSNIRSMESALVRGDWWRDVGLPVDFNIPVNSGIKGQAYRLQYRKEPFII